MKKMMMFVAAALPLALLAGFSDDLNLGALADIPEECKKLSGKIEEYGMTSGNIWTPDDVYAEAETGKLYSNGSYIFAPGTLDEYVQFGTYDDEASIEAFMARGEFWKTDQYGELYLEYTPDALNAIYSEMEKANYETFGAIIEEVEANVEEFVNRETMRNGGRYTRAATMAENALIKFFESGKNRKPRGTLSKFLKKAREADKDYQRRRAQQELKAAQSTDAWKTNLEAKFSSLSARLDAFALTSMDNFHKINAYLGSTNSMAYIVRRESVQGFSDFDEEELERWRGVSAPEKIDDNYGFGASQYGGRRWEFIYDNLASTYMMWAWPIVKDGSGDPQPGFLKFMEQFGLTGLVPRYKGFVESINYDSEAHPVTNWFANGITAPKNWADGNTIKVTNGVFVATGGVSFSGTGVDPTPVSATNYVFKAGTNSNISVQVSELQGMRGEIMLEVYWK